MQNSEKPPLTKEEIESLRVDQLIKKYPEKREKSSPNEDTQENLPTAPRRSERLKAKKDPICGFGCCISLLALLLLAGQAQALNPLLLNRARHFQRNISESTKTHQTPLSLHHPGLTTFNTSPLNWASMSSKLPTMTTAIDWTSTWLSWFPR